MWAEADINGIKLWEGGWEEGRLFSSVGTCKNIGPIHIVPTPPPHARPLITLLVSLVARPPRLHLTRCPKRLKGFIVCTKFLVLIVHRLGCKIQIWIKSLNDPRHNKRPLHGITWEAQECFVGKAPCEIEEIERAIFHGMRRKGNILMRVIRGTGYWRCGGVTV